MAPAQLVGAGVKMNVRTAIGEFILAAGADGLGEKTLIWYTSLLKRFASEFGDHPVETVTVSNMRHYLVRLREQQYSDDTLHGHTRALKRFWEWSAREYQIVNPMEQIKYPKQPKPKMPKAVNVDDVIKLLEACDDTPMGKRDKAIVAFLMDTGCRVAGLCGLRMEELDLELGRAYVIEKGSKRRVVFFTAITGHLLREWIAVRNPESSTVFHARSGEALKPNGLLQMLIRLKERAGVTGRANPHAFRHGFAREYIRSGGSLATLSRILGHESQEVTALFYAVFEVDELAQEHGEHSPMLRLKNVIEDDESDDI